MFGSNRRNLVAVGLSAFALGTLVTALNNTQQQHKQAIASKQTGDDYERRPQQFDTDHAGVLASAQRFVSNPEPANDTERQNRDLAAQENTAAWAFWMVLFSAGQLILSGFGLWALLRTIRQGEENLEFARQSFDEERRAWVDIRVDTIDVADFGHDLFGVHAILKFVNQGDTPAYKIRYGVALFGRPGRGAFEAIQQAALNAATSELNSYIFMLPSTGHKRLTTLASEQRSRMNIEVAENAIRPQLVVVALYEWGTDRRPGKTVKIFPVSAVQTDEGAPFVGLAQYPLPARGSPKDGVEILDNGPEDMS